MRFDTHLCLVSAQATPNLAPALDPDFKPRRVVLAVSQDMREKARSLESVLKRHGIAVEKLTVNNAYDFNDCWDVFSGWIGNQKNAALNVTGGTKVMAMAAQDVFREVKKPVFYVNVENDEVIRLDVREKPFTLPTKIKLPEYLEAHGYSVSGNPAKPDINAGRRDFIDRLAYESGRLGRALGQLNWLAQQAQPGLISPALDTQDRDSRLDELIRMFEHDLQLELRDGKLIFPDEAARQFVNGGWLEQLVYQALAQIAPGLGIADYAIGLEVLAQDGKTRNELDAACLYRNTLYLIECKSANLAAPGRGNECSGTDALYKLDALRIMGGQRTRAALVDFRGSLRDADKRRAAQMNLRVISGSQLGNLQGELKAWLK